MALITYYTKGILTNRNLWFWGVAFMIFWLVLGAYSFAQGLPRQSNILVPYTASWYGTIALYSLSSLAISIAYSIYYASSPLSYAGTLVGSSSVLGAILSVIMLVSTYGLFSTRFSLRLTPSNPIEAILISALAGIFMMTLAMFLVLIAVNYVGLQNINLVTFVPLILAYGFGFSQLTTPLPPALLYASPYNAIQSLLFQAYSGLAPPAQLDNASSSLLQWQYLFASLIIWIIMLFLIDSYLLRKIRPRQVEEGRQI